MLDLYTFIEALWLIVPAYAANGLIPIFRGKHPVDFNKKFKSGKPILGPGKTWEGWIFACIIGAIIGTIQMFAYPYLPFDLSPVTLIIVPMSPLFGALLGFGTVVGDMCGSFIKRRLGLKRGAPAPILDQDDFVVGTLIFASLLVVVKWEWWIWLLVITPIIHLVASFIGNKIKLKREPW